MLFLVVGFGLLMLTYWEYPLSLWSSGQDDAVEADVCRVLTIIRTDGLCPGVPLAKQILPLLKTPAPHCLVGRILVSEKVVHVGDRFTCIAHAVGHYIDHTTEQAGHPLFPEIGDSELFADAFALYVCLRKSMDSQQALMSAWAILPYLPSAQGKWSL